MELRQPRRCTSGALPRRAHQKEIARQIRSQGGHYVLAVKGNQPALHAAVQEVVMRAADTDFAGVRSTTSDSADDGHGRHEERCVTVITDPVGLPEGWNDAHAVVLVSRERTADGKTTGTMHYYLASLRATAKQMGRFIRRHWAIENELHWSFDITFGEDANRTREKHAGDNLGLIRRVAVSLLKQDKAKGSLKVKRLKAGWNPDYLLRVLQGFPDN